VAGPIGRRGTGWGGAVRVDAQQMKMELIEGSETAAFRTQTPGNYPKENILLTTYTHKLTFIALWSQGSQVTFSSR
jgi:hypothetical protein